PGLGRRLLLSVPRLQVRPGRAGLCGRAGADEPDGAAVPLSQRHHDPDRLGQRECMMATRDRDVFDSLGHGLSALGGWIDQRVPMTKPVQGHATEYYATKNFNVWYGFGVLALVVLVVQVLSGNWLTMNYEPSAEGAFASFEYIMPHVDWGWLIRYMLAAGASAFFIVVYLHMFRGLMYGSYKGP